MDGGISVGSKGKRMSERLSRSIADVDNSKSKMKKVIDCVMRNFNIRCISNLRISGFEEFKDFGYETEYVHLEPFHLGVWELVFELTVMETH